MLVASICVPYIPPAGRSPERRIFRNALPVKTDKDRVVVIPAFIQSPRADAPINDFPANTAALKVSNHAFVVFVI